MTTENCATACLRFYGEPVPSGVEGAALAQVVKCEEVLAFEPLELGVVGAMVADRALIAENRYQ